jgi:hypothetical protein
MQMVRQAAITVSIRFQALLLHGIQSAKWKILMQWPNFQSLLAATRVQGTEANSDAECSSDDEPSANKMKSRSVGSHLNSSFPVTQESLLSQSSQPMIANQQLTTATSLPTVMTPTDQAQLTPAAQPMVPMMPFFMPQMLSNGVQPIQNPLQPMMQFPMVPGMFPQMQPGAPLSSQELMLQQQQLQMLLQQLLMQTMSQNPSAFPFNLSTAQQGSVLTTPSAVSQSPMASEPTLNSATLETQSPLPHSLPVAQEDSTAVTPMELQPRQADGMISSEPLRSDASFSDPTKYDLWQQFAYCLNHLMLVFFFFRTPKKSMMSKIVQKTTGKRV